VSSVKARRFADEVDEIADRLQDAAEDFRDRRATLLGELAAAKDVYADAVIAAEDWAVANGLIDAPEWTDEQGELFLPWPLTEVTAELVPDLGTLFRERVADLTEGDEES